MKMAARGIRRSRIFPTSRPNGYANYTITICCSWFSELRPEPAAILQDARRRHTLQIHKPSARVSFGLPDTLSFQARSHAMVACRSGTNTRQGKRQGQAAKQPAPPSWERNADITKIKAQAGKDKPDVRLCVLDTVDGRAQPGQYGCDHCRLGHGSACPFGCQAFLRLPYAAADRQARSGHVVPVAGTAVALVALAAAFSSRVWIINRIAN